MSASGERPHLVLGVDIGTTTVKACLVDGTRTVLQSASRETKSSMASELGPAGNEQDVQRICTALQFCVSRMTKESLARVTHVAISGQMHGCVLWKQGEAWKRNNFGRYEVEDAVSCLYTWQDRRCTPDFLASLPKPDSHLRLSTGHGCATILWLSRNKPDLLTNYDRAGTVQDLVVSMLCALDRPVMSAQNAAGWGYFNTETRTWNIDRLEEANFPLHLLPDVTVAGSIVGHMSSTWYGIPEGTPVFAALGDLQCSVYSIMENEHDAVMNLSTSAQLSFLMPEGFSPPQADPSAAVEYFPYFKGRYLAVAASLNGGNVLAVFVRMLQQWTHELGLGVPESKIWEKITTAAQDDFSTESDIVVIPTLYGERHLSEQRASVHNIDPHCLTLGKVSRGLFRGLIANLYSMMPREILIDAGIQRIMGSGTALTRNVVLQKEVEKQYQLPVVYGAGSDAAVGVALAILPHL